LQRILLRNMSKIKTKKSKSKNHIVFQPPSLIQIPGEGPSTAQIMLIGEAPGAQEIEQSRPFIGRSGQLLRSVLKDLQHSQNPQPQSEPQPTPLPQNDLKDNISPNIFHPNNLYITNIVKFRPPENRDPTKAEIKKYAPILDQEINTINPKLIITLGRFSMAKFLPKVKISQVHGQLHQVDWKKVGSKSDSTKNRTTTNMNIPTPITPTATTTLHILPMYHPAAALRSTRVKNTFIDDFKQISKVMKEINR